MGFVKTEDEIEAIKDIIYPTHFEYESIVVRFETDEEFLREVLPPCFEPPKAPCVAKAFVSSWQSRRSGFDCAMVDLPARFGDYEGWYHLTHLINGDMPITLGREMWGEAKKRGEMHLEFDGNKARGWGERNGVKLIEIEAEFDPEKLPPQVNEQKRLELKAFISSDGRGLQYNPIVLKLEQTEYIDELWKGSGKLTFRGSDTDPTDTVPIVKILDAGHEIGTSTVGVVEEIEMSDRDPYLPYVWGRAYDLSQTHTFDDDKALSRNGSFSVAST